MRDCFPVLLGKGLQKNCTITITIIIIIIVLAVLCSKNLLLSVLCCNIFTYQLSFDIFS